MNETLSLIPIGSDAYKVELALRNELLRKPIGLDLFDEDLSREDTDCHIGAFIDGALVGCLILTPLDGGEIKMRQVAVREEYQGLGIGKKLVAYCEIIAREKGYRRIVLAARKTAIGFYEKLGYQIVGEEFVEVGIAHFKMAKQL